MKLRVASWLYHLRISPKPIVYEGRPRMGLCREGTRELLISPDCPPQSRLAVALHEYFHAWLFHTGQPTTAEEMCDLFATAAASAIDSLSISGGKEALLRLQPGESPQPGAAKLMLTRNRYCRCGQTVPGGDVACVRSELHADAVDLAIYCEHCNHTQRWAETVTIGGAPLGMVLGDASFERGDTRGGVVASATMD